MSRGLIPLNWPGELARKSFWHRPFAQYYLYKFVHRERHLLEPEQHRPQWESIQVIPPTTAMGARQDRIMEPYPQVPHQEPDRHVQEPHREPRRRRPNPTLVHLPIAGLDPEPAPVGVLDPVEPLGADPPIGVDPGLAALLAALAAPVPALDADRHRRRALPGIAQGVLEPTAPLHRLALNTCEPLGPSGWSGLRPWPTTGT